MDPFEAALATVIASVLIGVATYFTSRQYLTWRTLHTQVNLPHEQRRYVIQQTARRLFGSFLLLLVAGLLIGSLFLDYDPLKIALDDADPLEAETAKQSTRFLVGYWMMILVVLMVILALAVFDLWATARFGVHLQKQLAKEHQHALEAELAQIRQRRAEMN